MARRKNTRFIDPRYFMDEKTVRLDEVLSDLATKVNKAYMPNHPNQIAVSLAKAWLVFLIEKIGVDEESLRREGASHNKHFGQYWPEFLESKLYQLTARQYPPKLVDENGYKEIVGPTADEVLQHIR